MNTQLAVKETEQDNRLSARAMAVIASGDLSGLSNEEKFTWIQMRCEAIGLDWKAQPFNLMKDKNNKLILYANKNATDQLCGNRGITTQITSERMEGGAYIVRCRATDKDGRFTENIGSVPIENLRGDALSNALMKTVTKALRRTVLSHCGLGMLDETEVDSVPGAVRVTPQSPQNGRTVSEPTIMGKRPPNVDENGEIHDDIPSRPPLSKRQQEEALEAEFVPRVPGMNEMLDRQQEAQDEYDRKQAAPTINKAQASAKLKAALDDRGYAPPDAEQYKRILKQLRPALEAGQWTAQDFLEASTWHESLLDEAIKRMYVPDAGEQPYAHTTDAAAKYQSPASAIKESLNNVA